MIVTEKEAAELWCQETRITPETTGFHPMSNREEPVQKSSSLGSVSRCIGARCMAWRWRDPAVTGLEAPGYCGKAGYP